jgi:hypothetical protein
LPLLVPIKELRRTRGQWRGGKFSLGTFGERVARDSAAEGNR